MHQLGGVLLGAEKLDEPVAQRGFFLLEPLMLRDDLVLAPLQRVIEFRHDADLVVMNSLDRSAFSAAAGKWTSTSWMPRSWALRLIWAKL